MEYFLASNYGSSPSSSPSSSQSSHLSSPRAHQRVELQLAGVDQSANSSDDALLTRGEQNALLLDAPNNSVGAGCGSHRPTSEADINGYSWDSVNADHKGTRLRNETASEGKLNENERHSEKNHDDETKRKAEPFAASTKKRKVGHGKARFLPRVVVAGYDCHHQQNSEAGKDLSNSNPCTFERNHPHWEGRWAGHVHLPFPPMKCLDILGISSSDDDDHNEGMSSIEKHGMGGVKAEVARDGNSSEQIANEKASRGVSENSDVRNGDVCSEDSSDESEISSDDDRISMSRSFLLVARKLILYWAQVINDSIPLSQESDDQSCFKSNVVGDEHSKKSACADGGIDQANETSYSIFSTIVIVPHIQMQRKGSSLVSRQTTTASAASAAPMTSLHISLSRPIYLPAPSVDPFLADISKHLGNIRNSHDRNHHQYQQREGLTLQLQPCNATIFTNDQRTRSFLSIPVSGESSRWIKRVLLPPIDATMERFGQESYYRTEEGGCVLHVSVASVKGDMVKQILKFRRSEIDNKIRSIPLFSLQQNCIDGIKAKNNYLETLPTSIPIPVDQVICEFGKAKKVMIPL